MIGKCYCCGKDIDGKTAKRHILSCKSRLNNIEEYLNKSKIKKDKFIIKMVDKYMPSVYSIYLSIDKDTTLRSLDTFLRDVWMECCGHLSEFEINGTTYTCSENLDEDFFDDEETMDINLKNVISVGNKFVYSYDYGSTSRIILEVINEYTTGSLDSTIEILARNNESKPICYKCDNKAKYMDYESQEFVCGECVEGEVAEDDDFLTELGYTNSPRDGVCGYEGSESNEEKYLKGNKTKFKSKGRKKSKKNGGNNGYDEIADIFNNEVESIFMNSMEKVTKDLINRSLKCKVTNDLETILKSNTNDYIKDILDNLQITYKSSDKKEILINKFKESYKGSIKEVFKYIDNTCYEDLKLVLKNKGIINSEKAKNIESIIFLERMGIIYHSSYENNNFCISVPKEVLELIEEINSKDIAKNDEIVKLFKGMIYYYGVIALEQFINRLPKEVNIDKELEEIDKILKIASQISMDYDYINGLGINEYIDDAIELIEMIDKETVNNDDFKVLTKTELLRSFKTEYIGDHSIYKPLIKVITDNYNTTTEMLDKLRETIYLCCQLESDENKLIEFLFDTLEETELIKNEIIQSACKVYNKIPLWKYRGYTKAEKQNANRVNWEEVKIGRNDICNCGSGKKYKKCCGGKVIAIKFN
ncbi:SEC-C domain-containing protein [Clostridium gasigenes]|uniref:IS1096 element passenger TnpR family protein n=1 Tax=Clostridium gasigenes TaxID=94869 RepID=UPI001626D150|nr:SEC-C metal-binding domain-containing protein [Clostridium gasigenes]MBB6623514.1 SEC-C domain-containing protein [Clostridium gasigenes]